MNLSKNFGILVSAFIVVSFICFDFFASSFFSSPIMETSFLFAFSLIPILTTFLYSKKYGTSEILNLIMFSTSCNILTYLFQLVNCISFGKGYYGISVISFADLGVLMFLFATFFMFEDRKINTLKNNVFLVLFISFLLLLFGKMIVYLNIFIISISVTILSYKALGYLLAGGKFKTYAILILIASMIAVLEYKFIQLELLEFEGVCHALYLASTVLFAPAILFEKKEEKLWI